MQHPLKRIIRKVPLYNTVHNWRSRKRLEEWEKQGRPVPPPHIVKQRTLQTYAQRFGLRILVETGTLYGEMIEAMKDSFERLYSIELSKDLYEQAKRRFRGIRHIELIHGDSGVELGKVLDDIDQPALFWLDGHYSSGVTAKGIKETPIYEEIDHILSAPDRGHVIIIDDARCFGKYTDYPSIEELSEHIRAKRPDIDIAVEDDSIRITPKTPPDGV